MKLKIIEIFLKRIAKNRYNKNFFQNYFEYLYKITIDKDVHYIRQMYFNLTLIIFWILRYTFLYISPNLKLEWDIIILNMEKLNGRDAHMNLWNAGLFIMCFVLVRLYYFYNNTPATNLIYQILIQYKTDFFLQGTSKESKTSHINAINYLTYKVATKFNLILLFCCRFFSIFFPLI